MWRKGRWRRKVGQVARRNSSVNGITHIGTRLGRSRAGIGLARMKWCCQSNAGDNAVKRYAGTSGRSSSGSSSCRGIVTQLR